MIFMYNASKPKDEFEGITKARVLYKAKLGELEELTYLTSVLKANWVSEIKANAKNIFNEKWLSDAQNQRGMRYKKDRPQFESLKSILESSLKIDKMKIKEFLSCGYDNYAYSITFEVGNKDYRLDIPILSNVNSKNIYYANEGKFQLLIRDSPYSWTVIDYDYDLNELGKRFKRRRDEESAAKPEPETSQESQPL